MAEIQMQGHNWVASVLVTDSPRPDDLYHVTVNTLGDTKDDAFLGASFVRDILAGGRVAYMRVNPEAHSETDFDTKETRHTGYARFSFRLEPGEWQSVVNSAPAIGFGSLQCKEAV